MERRSLLAIILCFLIFFGWQKLYIEPRMPKRPTAESAQRAQGLGSTSEAVAAPKATGAAEKAAPSVPAVEKALDSATGSFKASNGASVFTDWTLKNYRVGPGEAINLKTVTLQERQVALAFDDPAYAYLGSVRGEFHEKDGALEWRYEDDAVQITRKLSSGADSTTVGVLIQATFKKAPPKFAFVSLNAQSADKDPQAQDRQLMYWANQDIHREQIKESMETKTASGPVKWIASANRYFVFSLINEAQAPAAGALIQSLGAYRGQLALVYPMTGNTISIPLKAYFGPKELGLLRSVDPTLDHTVDFGWFTIFAYPLLWLMKWFHGVFGNWGVAIILLTLVVKILTFPLTYKSMKGMKKMAVLQPQLNRLKEKYKDPKDKETLNREMLTLMRTQGYNPMAGCLPILIQMPVFFALYRLLYSAIELYGAPFALWIKDLSVADPIYVTPILLTLLMWLQQRLTPNTATDPMQQKMMQLMPIIFGVFMISLPSGLTVYMLVNSVASIGQQVYLNKKLGLGRAPAAAGA